MLTSIKIETLKLEILSGSSRRVFFLIKRPHNFLKKKKIRQIQLPRTKKESEREKNYLPTTVACEVFAVQPISHLQSYKHPTIVAS